MRALIIVDMLNDFVDGKLANPGNGFALDQAVLALLESRTFATRCAPSVQ
jgi:hypothetical protein